MGLPSMAASAHHWVMRRTAARRPSGQVLGKQILLLEEMLACLFPVQVFPLEYPEALPNVAASRLYFRAPSYHVGVASALGAEACHMGWLLADPTVQSHESAAVVEIHLPVMPAAHVPNHLDQTKT